MENKKGLLTADLIKAKLEMGNIAKSKTVRAGQFSYTYADIQDILEAIEPVLGKYNLEIDLHADIHENGAEIVKCILSHTSGEERISRCYLPPRDKDKDWGGSFSYRGRYLLSKMLGLKLSDAEDAEVSDNEEDRNPYAKITPDIAQKLMKLSPEYRANICSFNKLEKLEDMTMKQYNDLVKRWEEKKKSQSSQ